MHEFSLFVLDFNNLFIFAHLNNGLLAQLV
jgi:hypothetical protein